MKKLLSLLVASMALLVTACSSDAVELPAFPGEDNGNDDTRALFAEDDGAPRLSGSLAEQASELLLLTDPYECTDTLGRVNITPEQYAEIKAFTDDLVAECSSQFQIYRTCFNWIVENIKYDYVNNDPYAVFVNRKAVCQGYSNLLFVMLHSQGVPAFVTNGYLNPYGGHAWNYVYFSSKWYVSDPTNGVFHAMSRFDDYKNTLMPYSFDILLYKADGCSYNYNECHLNICDIESNDNAFVVPFSVKGKRVTSLNPMEKISPNIRQLYIGKNIETLGENIIGLENNAPNVEYVYVDPENKFLASYLGAVYRRNGSELQLLYIPSALSCLELMPIKKIEKNMVYQKNGIESVIIAPGTKTIDDWAFENCPNLKVAYIPEDVQVAKNAFYRVHKDFKIIRGDFTNIPQIKAD